MKSPLVIFYGHLVKPCNNPPCKLGSNSPWPGPKPLNKEMPTNSKMCRKRETEVALTCPPRSPVMEADAEVEDNGSPKCSPAFTRRRNAVPIGTWDLLWRLSARLNLDPFFQVKRESTILRLGHSPLFSMLLPAFQTESLCSRSETFGFPFLPTVPHLSASHLDASLHNSAPSHPFSSTHPELEEGLERMFPIELCIRVAFLQPLEDLSDTSHPTEPNVSPAFVSPSHQLLAHLALSTVLSPLYKIRTLASTRTKSSSPGANPSSISDSSSFHSTILAMLSASSSVTSGMKTCRSRFITADGECMNGLFEARSNFVFFRMNPSVAEPVTGQFFRFPLHPTKTINSLGPWRSPHAR